MKRTIEEIDARQKEIVEQANELGDQRKALLREYDQLRLERFRVIAKSLLNVADGVRHLPVVESGGTGEACNNKIGTVIRVHGSVVTVDFGNAGKWRTTVYDIVPVAVLGA